MNPIETRESMTINTLIQVLGQTSPGALTKDVCDKVVPLLRECWQDFRGWDETSMQPWKLDRAEELHWNPPLLSFTIERHGAIVLGSTRAELQRWKLNLTTRTAQGLPQGYRQLRPVSPKLDVKSIAADVCEAVRQGSKSNSDLVRKGVVVWKGDDEVWIYHGKLISGGFKQTVGGRRKRFREELTNMMEPLGWKQLKLHQAMIFSKEPNSQTK